MAMAHHDIDKKKLNVKQISVRKDGLYELED